MKRAFIVFLLASVSGFAQSQAEIDAIKKNYSVTDINNLKEVVSIFEASRQEKIQAYLDAHVSEKKEFYVEGNKYLLYDVIDGKPVYQTTDNRLSALAAKTNTLYPGGNLGLSLTGAGMKVGVWDSGWALKTHVEFITNSVSRVTTPDTAAPSPATELHSTHVTGTICAKGVATSAKGMAYQCNVASYDWTNDKSEVINEAATNGLLISNHSYGVPIIADDGSQNVPDWYMGCYNTDANQWDQIAYDLPYYLMVASAGNSGGDSYPNGLGSGLDKLTGNKNCKNNLVIANANPLVNTVSGAINSLAINNSSSQGPSDDGRIKPDIAADGTNLYSTSNASTTSYDTLTGTSMASPSVAGSLILLQQHYNNLHASYMKAATLKGLVCNTVLDDPANVGPDPYFGYGFLNTREAAVAITGANSSAPTAVITEANLAQNGTYTIQVAVNNPKTLKATICWTDKPATAKNSQLNSPDPVLINDLDIRITKDTEVYFPWKLDLANLTSPAIKGDNIVDNVEKVEVDNAAGIYTIQVTHKGTLVGGSQDYSLVVTGFDQQVLATPDFATSALSVYPNPVGDELHVICSDAMKGYALFDVQGRLMTSGTVSNQTTLDLSTYSLVNGVYLLSITTEKGSFVQKIVKK
jgi:serine protease AprX